MEKITPKYNYIKKELQLYPHVTDKKTTHDTRYDPNTYISVQTKVNNNNKFEKDYISKLVSEGWVALKNVEDILIFPKGRPFKYRLNGDSLSGADEGTFRSGGWLVEKNINDHSNNNSRYVLYKGYNGAIFSLQIKDLLEVYIKSKKKEIPVFKKPDLSNKTNFPVYLDLPNSNKPVIIYYAKDFDQKKRFMNTIKFKKAKAFNMWSWSSVFENDDNNN